MQNDTIAAIATAMSPSGIGIIRISGDDALSVIDRIYKSKNNKKKISACHIPFIMVLYMTAMRK